MATRAGQDGVKAVQERRYAEALPLLTKAIADSKSPTWLLARAQAYQQTKQLDKALADAELAYHAAAERGSGTSRKLMIDAQYRRAVILYQLRRFADADCCAKWSQLLCEGKPAREDDGQQRKIDTNGDYTVTMEEARAEQLAQNPATDAGAKDGMAVVSAALQGGGKGDSKAEWNRAFAWRIQTLAALEKLPEGDAGRKITVDKIPPKREVDVALGDSDAHDREEMRQAIEEARLSKKQPELPVGPVSDDKLKSRFDFYQSPKTVTISMFVKDVKKDTLEVHFRQKTVSLGPLPRELAPYLQPSDRQSWSTITLGGDINPAGSRFTATPRKIELILDKATPGTKWATWGSEEIGTLAGESSFADDAAAASQASMPAPEAAVVESSTPGPTKPIEPETKTIAKPPAYPTSAKSGPKNWDQLGEGEAGDEEDKQDVNHFFKEIYKNATPEQQRAMMKSFTESNGTSLSTDWNDVKDRTVETVPPEGVESKKW